MLPALQTIARGIGFRFEDVKTLLYNEVGAHCGWCWCLPWSEVTCQADVQDLLCGGLAVSDSADVVLPNRQWCYWYLKLLQGKRREAAGLTRGIKVGVPGVELLKVNYR